MNHSADQLTQTLSEVFCGLYFKQFWLKNLACFLSYDSGGYLSIPIVNIRLYYFNVSFSGNKVMSYMFFLCVFV